MRRSLAVLSAMSMLTLAPSSAEHPTISRSFDCSGAGGATAAMENEYIVESGYGPCWFHTGHHTYDLGGVYAVDNLKGRVFSVEVQFSPPIEADASGITIVVEASLDGRNWEPIGTMPYAALSTRQDILFDLDTDGVLARYLRIRQPLSAAQGLSGYLDSSRFEASLRSATADPLPAWESDERELRCASDTMERIYPGHPCWFGGINRYDSPSVFHTYPLDGVQQVGQVEGVATFLPWRTDDYTQNGGNRRTLQAHLQSSVDGEDWTTVHTFTAEYGVPAGFVTDEVGQAAYLRLVAEYHKGVTTHPALKHVRGMLFDSTLLVTRS
ncbi:MAG: hypothetical protein ACLGH3_09095 [Actinomycetota bacterium]